MTTIPMTAVLRRPVVWLPISVALLAFVAWRSRIWEATSILARVDPVPLVVAVALNGVVLVLWAARSADLLAAARRPVPLLPLVPMTAFANTMNNATPGSMGELVRLYLLRAHHDVDYATGGAVVLIERVVAIAYLSGSAAILWLGHAWAVPLAVQVAAVAALVAAPAGVYALGLRPAALAARLPAGRVVGVERWRRFGADLGRLDETIARLLMDPLRAVFFALFSGGVFVVYAAQLVLAGLAFGVHLDPAVAWGALGLGITAGVVSLLPFGLGSTDVVVVALLGAAGVPALEATALTLAYRFVSTLPLGLAGIASYAFLSASLPDAGPGGALAAARRGLGTRDDGR
jgi:glycosyltransferase 2 family protein